MRFVRLASSVCVLVAGLVSCAPRQPATALTPEGSFDLQFANRSGRAAPSLLVARAWAGREPMTTARAWAAVLFAWRQVGKPYCWGGTGPACFDCSGLVERAWGSVGVRLPRTADAIASSLERVSLEDVRSGDVLWWPGHVGLYAGNGWIIEALDARDGVVRRPALKNPYRAFRPKGDTAAAAWKDMPL